MSPSAPTPSGYERPSPRWRCGREAAGQACAAGPDGQGSCRAAPECSPLRRGERWECTRSALRGGPCAEGPQADGTCRLVTPPCQPVRSLRALRGLVTRWTAGVAAALALFALGSGHRAEWLSPGPLSARHGREQGPGVEAAGACGDCHAAGEGVFGPLRALFGAHAGGTQSELCLRCHALGARPLEAHGRAPEELAVVTARLSGKTPHAPAARRWECATCHREHRGHEAPLTVLGDQACQACHVRRFASLAEGHPELSGYPYRRALWLRFDHNKHRAEHFRKSDNRKADRPFVCRACHPPDASGRSRGVAPFEETCALCHADQIADNDGFTVLAVPGLDLEGLAGARIGAWPQQDEADLTPFTRLLLRGSPGGAPYMRDVRALDLLDLVGSEAEEAAAVEELSWDVKRLLAELETGGQPALTRRVARALGAGGQPGPAVPELLAGLEPATVADARRAWFPQLRAELEALDAGAPPATHPSSSPPSEPAAVSGAELRAWLAGGGWYLAAADFSLRYRPARHADPVVRAWLDLAAAQRGRQPDALGMLEQLGKPTSPGRCLKCHVLESLPPAPAGDAPATPAGPGRVRWTARRTGLDERPLVRFSHASHVPPAAQDASCTGCHLLVADAPPAGRDQALARPDADFVSLRKSRCLTCHTRESAGEACLLCHNYHLASVPPEAARPAS